MKIEDQGDALRVNGLNPVQKTGPAFDLFQAYRAQGPAATGPDAASLSPEAQAIEKYRHQLDALPDVREDRVEAARAKVNTENFQLPAEDLSEAMFRLAELDGWS